MQKAYYLMQNYNLLVGENQTGPHPAASWAGPPGLRVVGDASYAWPGRGEVTSPVGRFAHYMPAGNPETGPYPYLTSGSNPQTPAPPASKPTRVRTAISSEVPYNRRTAWR